MRVRISYSVDLEEVPEKTAKLLEEAMADLKEITNVIGNIAVGIKKEVYKREQLSVVINETRQILAKVDSRLSDSSMIMAGFHAAIEELNKEKEEEKDEVVLDEEVYGAD